MFALLFTESPSFAYHYAYVGCGFFPSLCLELIFRPLLPSLPVRTCSDCLSHSPNGALGTPACFPPCLASNQFIFPFSLTHTLPDPIPRVATLQYHLCHQSRWFYLGPPFFLICLPPPHTRFLVPSWIRHILDAGFFRPLDLTPGLRTSHNECNTKSG